MKTFQINYELTNGSSMVVGLVADNREQAVQTLLSKQKDIKSIHQVSSGIDVHVLTDSIKAGFVNGMKEIKLMKKEVSYLKRCLMDSDDEIERLRHREIDTSNTTRYTKEIEMLHEKIVQMEMNKQLDPKPDNTNELNVRIKQLESELKSLPEQIPDDKMEMKVKALEEELKLQGVVEKFICPECLKSYKNPKGVRMHFNKMHKKGLTDE